MFFLIFAGPIGMTIIGYQNSKKKTEKYNFRLYLGGLLYVPVLLATIGITWVASLFRG
jgi:uncharacterized membrane protein YsdA (DUF1294 family)